jgi:PIN domain nuclease of toxin-antitoxin system
MNGHLLDTHVLLWLLSEPEQLSPQARTTINMPSAGLWFSAASIWEMSIKRAAARLRTPENLLEVLEANQIRVLPVGAIHALAVAGLPMHHRDPFDRMLVAQAQTEGLTLITRDAEIQRYAVPIIVA